MSDVFAPPESQPAPAPTRSALGAESWRELRLHSHFVVGGLVVFGIVGLVLLLGELAMLAMGTDAVLSDDMTLLTIGLPYFGAALLSIAVFLATAVAWGMWSFRAAKNLRAFSDDTDILDFTPGWVVGWWFIPFANLWQPFRVHQELWSQSDPDDPEYTAPGWVTAWWGCWIGAGLLSNISYRMPDSMIDAATAVDALSSCLSLVCTLLAILLVRNITQRQETQATRLGLR